MPRTVSLVALLLLGPAVAPAPLRADPPAAPAVTPQAHLFLAPTARSLPRGKGSFGLTEIAFPWAEVGIVSRVSLRTLAIPPLGGLTGAGLALDPRLQLVDGSFAKAAVGVIQVIGAETGGIGYGVATFGGATTAATLGYGYSYGDLADSVGSRGVVFLGLEQALGRSVRVVVEAYVGGEALGLPEKTLMTGLRLGGGRLRVDLAAVVPFYETGSGAPGALLTISRSF